MSGIPTPAQRKAIRYFATRVLEKGRWGHATYAACRRRGWLIEIDEFPFHAATDAGRAAIGLPPK